MASRPKVAHGDRSRLRRAGATPQFCTRLERRCDGRSRLPWGHPLAKRCRISRSTRGNAGTAYPAAISRLSRCTVPVPSPTIRRTLPMPLASSAESAGATDRGVEPNELRGQNYQQLAVSACSLVRPMADVRRLILCTAGFAIALAAYNTGRWVQGKSGFPDLKYPEMPPSRGPRSSAGARSPR